MQCNYVITANAKIDCFKLRYNHRDPIILEVNHFLPFFSRRHRGATSPMGQSTAHWNPKESWAADNVRWYTREPSTWPKVTVVYFRRKPKPTMGQCTLT